MLSAGLVSVLYCVCLLATKADSNVIRSPSQYPSLTFQVEPNNTPPSGDESFEIWPGDALNSHRDFSSDEKLSSAPELLALLRTPPIRPTAWYRTFLPIPVGFSFSNLFPKALSSFLSFATANNELHHHPHLPEPIDCSKYTIGEVLEWTLAHTPKPSGDDSHHAPSLHRLAWLVNISHPVKEALSDPNADLTLFAPDDEALTPPWKRKHHSENKHSKHAYETTQGQTLDDEASHVFWDALETIENEFYHPHERHVNLEAGLDNDDKEKKKKFFLHAIELVLKYHVSPGRKSLQEIEDRSTLPTALPISHDATAPRFRVRVGLPLRHHAPGELTLNFFSRLQVLKTRPIIAKNGIIYIIEKSPLLPPLSPLSQLFLFPKITSTLTSALQKTHLNNVLLPRWENKTIPLSEGSNLDSSSFFDDNMEAVDGRVESVLSSLIDDHGGKLKKESFTIFAPTNQAFLSLGPKANFFLFSPFGQHILRYVLSYHIVPHLIWNTDHCVKTEQAQSTKCDLELKSYQTVEHLHPFVQLTTRNRCSSAHQHVPAKANVTELFLPTLLGSRANESLPITLVEFRHLGKGRLLRRVYIKQSKNDFSFGPPDKHAIPVVVADTVAWGGALHVIPKLIRPPVPKGHHHRKDVQRALELSILTDV